jgi:RecA/RadA recombinase
LTHTALDRIFSKKGGVEAGRSLEIYGEYASGKSEIIWTLIAEAEGLIILIDSENTWSPDRFKQICAARGKDVADIAKRLMLFQPQNYMEQDDIVNNGLPDFDADGKILEIGLIAVDSLMCHWATSPDFTGREKLGVRAGLLGPHIMNLKRYAKLHNAVLVYSNQISMKPDAKAFSSYEDIIYPKGGPIIAHAGDHRILLRKGPANIRFARVVDSIEIPLTEAVFVLDEAGITDLPDPGERVKAMEIADKYGRRFLSGQVSSQAPAGKDYYKKAIKLRLISPEEAIEKEYLTKEEVDKVVADMNSPLANAESELKEIEELDKMMDVPVVEETKEDEI